MHIECPKDDKFAMPLSWVTTLTDENGETRDVISSRYENVTIVNEPKYLVCCGAIRGQGPESQKGHLKGCCKAAVASHKARIASRPPPVQSAPHVKIARKEYLTTIKKAVCPLIINYMIEGTSLTGAPKMHPAIPTECKAWSIAVGHKRTKPGQCEPGETCGRNCKLIPCIAIRLEKVQELTAREAYMAAVTSMDSMR
jgi:hypothetical protein